MGSEHDGTAWRRIRPQGDNTFALRKGDPLGERLGKVARERGMLLMLCDVVDGVRVGCFPDLYAALSGVENLQVVSL